MYRIALLLVGLCLGVVLTGRPVQADDVMCGWLRAAACPACEPVASTCDCEWNAGGSLCMCTTEENKVECVYGPWDYEFDPQGKELGYDVGMKACSVTKRCDRANFPGDCFEWAPQHCSESTDPKGCKWFTMTGNVIETWFFTEGEQCDY